MGSPGDTTDPLDAFLSRKYTHLIIGGGTAGLVVAVRLSENPALTVGVLEAGCAAFDEPIINVPGRFGESLGSKYDWQFESTKQPGLNGRSLPWPRGKVLGGTSALNFMTWNRGCREDYDAWEELGAEGWGWDGLLSFFKKSETFRQPNAAHQAEHKSSFDPSQHGTTGPLQTTYSVTYGASHQHWHSTLHQLGVQTNGSHFSGSNVGVWTSLTSVTHDKRERSYSATAYYRPNSGRDNLHLLTEAYVQEIVLGQEDGNWVANGVRFKYGGEEYMVETAGEVVVCAGTVQSPQLLELSGIGNPEILRAAGIDTKVDNPNVGEHLQEHMMTAMIFEIDPSITTPEALRADPVLAEAADKEYALMHSGPRTAISSSVVYLPFSHFVPTETLQKYASTLLSTTPTKLRGRAEILADRITSDQHLGQIEYIFDVAIYSPYFKSVPGKKYATMLQMLQYPFSKGSIHIPSIQRNGHGKRTTAEDKPIIDPKYYEGPGGAVDFECMVRSQSFANKICATAPLSSIIKQRVFPPAPILPESNDDDFSTWVRDTTISEWHPVGTCSMGGRQASDGYVVDARLRVYGTRNLRVCDASVMPLHVSAHIQATVYAIAEKGAALILDDWGKEMGVVG